VVRANSSFSPCFWPGLIALAQVWRRPDEADPLINEGAQALVIAELLLHGRETLTPDKLAAAFPLPGITNLVIGSVFLGLGLAAAPDAWRRI
jgi:hypothetical protein